MTNDPVLTALQHAYAAVHAARRARDEGLIVPDSFYAGTVHAKNEIQRIGRELGYTDAQIGRYLGWDEP